jgi:hypothetical protein
MISKHIKPRVDYSLPQALYYRHLFGTVVQWAPLNKYAWFSLSVRYLSNSLLS